MFHKQLGSLIHLFFILQETFILPFWLCLTPVFFIVAQLFICIHIIGYMYDHLMFTLSLNAL